MSVSPAVVFAYRRPEMVERRVHELINWSESIPIQIHVDGLRASANSMELNQRLQTIEASISLAESFQNIDVKIWNENLGVNQHAARVMEIILAEYDSLLCIEDDVSHSREALDFLVGGAKSFEAQAVVGYSKRDHFGIDVSFGSTLFPLQWGLLLKREVMEDYIRLMKDGKIRKTLIRRAFENFFGSSLSKYQKEKLTLYWFNHFFFCMKNGNYGDALFQYCITAMGSYYMEPSRSLVHDDARLNDQRSMNIRTKPSFRTNCDKATQKNQYQFDCSKCLMENSNIHDLTFRNLLGATKHRYVINLKEGHKQK